MCCQVQISNHQAFRTSLAVLGLIGAKYLASMNNDRGPNLELKMDF